MERPVPSKPEHAEAVSIETREGTETLETKFDPSAVQVAADDAGMGMCNPGPDADLEALLTEQDRIPATPPLPLPRRNPNEREHHHRNLRERRC